MSERESNMDTVLDDIPRIVDKALGGNGTPEVKAGNLASLMARRDAADRMDALKDFLNQLEKQVGEVDRRGLTETYGRILRSYDTKEKDNIS